MLSPQSRGAQASCDTAATNRCQTERMPSAAGLQEAQTTKAKLQRDLLHLQAEFAMRQFTNFYHRPSHSKFARLRTEPHRCRHGRDRRQLEKSSSSPLSSVRTACLDHALQPCFAAISFGGWRRSSRLWHHWTNAVSVRTVPVLAQSSRPRSRTRSR